MPLHFPHKTHDESTLYDRTSFPKLPKTQRNSQKKLGIAIVTPEIMGPSHGGIGTAYHSMAIALSRANHDITILYVPPEKTNTSQIRTWIESYAKHRIRLEILSEAEMVTLDSLWSNAKRSYRIMMWLQENGPFDIVHFPDWKGFGYYSLLSKHQGLDFMETKFVVGAHSTTIWDASFSFGDKSYYQDFLERTFLERECARLTDYLVSPSQFHLDYMVRQQNWTITDNAYVQPNIMISSFQRPNIESRQPVNLINKVNEFVFFGRLEKRKGVVLLCDALDHPKIRGRADFSVTFMGHNTYIDGKSALDYLRERAKKWKFAWQLIPRKDRDEALKYLSKPGRVGLIPSLSETMSYTVLECLWAGIPFLASRAGGIPELIDPDDLDQVTFEPTPDQFASALDRVIEKGVIVAKPSFDILENERLWVDWHQDCQAHRNQEIQNKTPIDLVSVCLVEDSFSPVSPELLKSIQSQDYPHIEIIIVQIGERILKKNCEHALSETFWVTLFQDGSNKASACNLASRQAQGKYLLFLDSKTSLKPDSISQFISVAQKTGSDILTCSQEYNSIKRNFPSNKSDELKRSIWFHLGNCLSLGALHNVFGHTNFLIKKSVFQSLKGFSERNDSGDFQWEFLARACASECHLETIPFPLVQNNESHHSNKDFQTPGFVPQHPYIEQIPKKYQELFLFIQASRFFHDPSPDGSFVPGFVNRPQAFVDEYWNSKPWKIYIPVANRFRKIFRLPLYEYPQIHTLTEAIRAVQNVQQSIFWTSVMLIKSLRNFLKKMSYRGK